MSGVDIRDLSRESLERGEFPAKPQADFRCFIAPEVHRGIQGHANEDLSVEICGVLVGRWKCDEHGPFAAVTDYIRCDNAASKTAEVTFTHDSWAQINAEMDSRFEDERIIGWYHTHPDFGIFLSERDCFIQEHFFNGPGQIAYVVDPVRKLEGVFHWRDGRPEPMSHYWVGDEIFTVDASRRQEPPAAADRSAAALDVDAPTLAVPHPTLLTPLTLALASLLMLLLGYAYGGWKTRWEERKIIEGAVAHYGVHKLMHQDLEIYLADLGKTIRGIRQEFAKLPIGETELTDEEIAEAQKRRRIVGANLQMAEKATEVLRLNYGRSPEEREVLAKLIAEKLAALQVPPSARQNRGAEKSPARKPQTANPQAGDGPTDDYDDDASPSGDALSNKQADADAGGDIAIPKAADDSANSPGSDASRD